MSPALRLAASLLVGTFGLGATLLAALPGVAAGLLLLLDYSLGGSLDVVRSMVAAVLWPQSGWGLLHRPSVVMHPAVAIAWSLVAAATGLAGTAMALAEWREGRPDWRAALPCWAASAACGGVPVLVPLLPAAALQLVGVAVRGHAARLAGGEVRLALSAPGRAGAARTRRLLSRAGGAEALRLAARARLGGPAALASAQAGGDRPIPEATPMDTPATPAASTLAVPVAMLTRYVADIFAAGGCERAEAECIATHLVSANLAGHDSHGVQRVPTYAGWLREGYVRPGQRITVTHETPTQAAVDGNYGFGQSIGEQAVDLGIAKAQAAGMAAIALRHSGHIGRIGDWAERAAAAGLVSIHFVNVAHGELVAPFGGVDRRFSTNPVCIGAPTPEGPPMILDFATSLVAEGKVAVASYGGKKLPEGALIRPDGQLSTDPETLYGPLAGTHLRNAGGGEGAIRAFGEHKGSGLAIMCEVLAGCLTGGETSGPIPGGKRGRISNGMLSVYLKPAAFGQERFREAVAEYAAYVKASRPAAAGVEVLVPGEPEVRSRAARTRDGVPLTAATWEAIVKTGAGFGLAAPM